MDRLHEKVAGGSLEFDDGTQITLEAHFDISPVNGGEEVGTILEHAHEAMDIAKNNALINIFLWERK